MARGIEIKGADKLRKKLADLGKKANAINRRAVNMGTTPILQAVRANVPIEEGDLKRAQTKKITSKGGRANGIVGADANYIVADGERMSRGELHPDAELKIPAKYDHLVEYGHANPDGTVTPAHPYIRVGWEEGIGEGQQKYEQAMKDGIEKAAGG